MASHPYILERHTSQYSRRVCVTLSIHNHHFLVVFTSSSRGPAYMCFLYVFWCHFSLRRRFSHVSSLCLSLLFVVSQQPLSLDEIPEAPLQARTWAGKVRAHTRARLIGLVSWHRCCSEKGTLFETLDVPFAAISFLGVFDRFFSLNLLAGPCCFNVTPTRFVPWDAHVYSLTTATPLPLPPPPPQ